MIVPNAFYNRKEFDEEFPYEHWNRPWSYNNRMVVSRRLDSGKFNKVHYHYFITENSGYRYICSSRNFETGRKIAEETWSPKPVVRTLNISFKDSALDMIENTLCSVLSIKEKISDKQKEYENFQNGTYSKTVNKMFTRLKLQDSKIDKQTALNRIKEVLESGLKDLEEDAILKKSDFTFTYVGKDKKWHTYRPSIKELLDYHLAKDTINQKYVDFLREEETNRS